MSRMLTEDTGLESHQVEIGGSGITREHEVSEAMNCKCNEKQ